MKLSRLLSAALLSVTLASGAQAQGFSVTFDDLLVGEPADGLVANGVTFADPDFVALVGPASFNCPEPTNCTNGVIQGVTSMPLGFSFSAPVARLQLDLNRITNFRSFLNLFDEGGRVFETVELIPSSKNDPDFGEFFGGTFSWSATGTFANSATLTHELDPDLDFEGYEIDNLSGTFAAAAAVPEPMTLSLLGAGLVGLAVARRRRNG